MTCRNLPPFFRMRETHQRPRSSWLISSVVRRKLLPFCSVNVCPSKWSLKRRAALRSSPHSAANWKRTAMLLKPNLTCEHEPLVPRVREGLLVRIQRHGRNGLDK